MYEMYLQAIVFCKGQTDIKCAVGKSGFQLQSAKNTSNLWMCFSLTGTVYNLSNKTDTKCKIIYIDPIRLPLHKS